MSKHDAAIDALAKRMAQELDVSVAKARAAILRLIRLGLIEVRP